LFDRGYVGVDPQHRLKVSPRLRTEFGNGERLYSMADRPSAVPERRADRPNREFLEWHLDTVFLAA
jgi:putative restriction endonuclease